MLTCKLKWLITFHLKVSACFLLRLSSFLILTRRVKVESFAVQISLITYAKLRHYKTWFSLLHWGRFYVAKKEIHLNDADSISFNNYPAETAHELLLVYSFCFLLKVFLFILTHSVAEMVKELYKLNKRVRLWLFLVLKVTVKWLDLSSHWVIISTLLMIIDQNLSHLHCQNSGCSTSPFLLLTVQSTLKGSYLFSYMYLFFSMYLYRRRTMSMYVQHLYLRGYCPSDKPMYPNGINMG